MWARCQVAGGLRPLTMLGYSAQYDVGGLTILKVHPISWLSLPADEWSDMQA